MISEPMAIRAFRHLVAERLGLDFPEGRLKEFHAALEHARHSQNLADLEKLFGVMEDQDLDNEAWQSLREQLTVGESYFFRDPAQLEVIRNRVLQPLAASGSPRRVRIWSAGCASGEEAYSLAAIAWSTLPEPLGWRADILGTDLQPSALQRAQTACYRDWSFRGMEPEVQSRWFRRSLGGWTVVPELQRLVRFKAHNLARDPFEPLAEGEGFDLILCRNVLIYFQEATRLEVLHHFLQALKPGGALVLGHNEISHTEVQTLNVEHCFDSLVIRPGQGAPPSLNASHPIEVAPVRPRPRPARVRDKVATSPVAPSDPLGKAREALATGEHGKALELAKGLRAVESLQVTGHALANLGRGEEALKLVVEGLARHPLEASLHYLHSLLSAERGDDGEVLRALDRTIYLTPDHVAALMDRARIHENHGRSKEAIRDIAQALEYLSRKKADEPVDGLEPYLAQDVGKHCEELLASFQQRAAQ
jgi:chemotaxis protein methyltransferase CheR